MLSLFILILFPIVSAQEAQKVEVGLYLLNLGRFDVGTGTFTADFYLSFQCETDCDEINFEFMNGRATSTEKIIDEKNEKFYRIQANLNSPVNLKNFPFDTQQMEIVIEDKTSTIEKIRYIPDMEKSGIDSSITFTGWKMGEWSAEEREHEYLIYDETYSQFVFKIPIERIIFNAIIKTFLPVIFIVLVMISSFFLDTDKVITRLGMAGSALVASVMFHISITNQIPPVGYLTFADKFMITTYFIVLLSFAMNVLILELIENNKKELAEKIHRKTEYYMFFVIFIIYALLFLFGI